jgi:hypothetical protein
MQLSQIIVFVSVVLAVSCSATPVPRYGINHAESSSGKNRMKKPSGGDLVRPGDDVNDVKEVKELKRADRN